MSSGFIINLTFDASAMAAPQSFRTAMETAVSILESTFVDNITLNFTVSYSASGGDATGGPSGGADLSYAQLRSALTASASSQEDSTSIASLPNAGAIDGDNVFYVSPAQEKALGLIDPRGSETDGSVTLTSAFGGESLIGAALHELTHAMGRVAGSSMDLFRYSEDGSGQHVFGSQIPSEAAYFSINGGVTKIADLGVSSDPGDFLNNSLTPDDPFSETASASYANPNYLTVADLSVMDVLGFHLGSAYDATPPTLMGVSTTGDGVRTAPGSNLILTFSEDVEAGSGSIVVHNASNGAVVETIAAANQADVSYAADLVTVALPTPLSPDTKYYVTIDPTALTDLAGNAFAGIASPSAISFTTYGSVASTASMTTLYGSATPSQLQSSGDDNTIYAGPNGDLLYGAPGDRLYGGGGSDVFAFASAAQTPISAPDTIYNFVSGTDKIDLSALNLNTLQNDYYTLEIDYSGTSSTIYIDSLEQPDYNAEINVSGAIVKGTDLVLGGGAQIPAGIYFSAADSGSYTFVGGPGDDAFSIGSGDDVVVGGTGLNTVDFADTAAQAVVTVDGDGVLWADIGAQAVAMTNVQVLSFSDEQVATAFAQEIIDGYESFFERAPTAAELGVWSAAMTSGAATPASFASTLADTPTGEANLGALITQLYVGYFERDPTPSEISVWSAAFQSGDASLTTINEILATVGAASLPDSIRQLYDVYMGRDALPSEVSVWQGALQSGADDLRQMQLVLAAQSGSQANEAAYLNLLYETWLGRSATAADDAYWMGLLSSGLTEPAQIRAALINDPAGQAYEAATISADYLADFGRAPTAAEVGVWQGLIAAGADYNTLQNALLSNPAASLADGIMGLYDAYFGRDATPAELEVWEGLLAGGATVATLRATLVDDPYGLAHTVSDLASLYETYLGRAPTSTELAAAEGLIQGGETFGQVSASLAASPAGVAFAVNQITPLYEADFGRVPTTSEIGVWTNALNGGVGLNVFEDVLLRSSASVTSVVAAAGHAATTWVDDGASMVVNGFTAADTIALSGPAFASFNPLDHAVQVANAAGGTDVLIYTDATHALLLENVSLASLHQSNFVVL